MGLARVDRINVAVLEKDIDGTYLRAGDFRHAGRGHSESECQHEENSSCDFHLSKKLQESGYRYRTSGMFIVRRCFYDKPKLSEPPAVAGGPVDCRLRN